MSTAPEPSPNVNNVNPLVNHHSEPTNTPTQATIWDSGTEPARSLAALAVAVTLTLVVLDTYATGGLGWIFDLGFIALCGALGLMARPGDFIMTGLLPPIVLIAVFVLLGLAAPGVVGHPHDGVVQVLVSGISTHSTALFVGDVLCLGFLSYRNSLLSQQ